MTNDQDLPDPAQLEIKLTTAQLAGCYARLFATRDGQIVLADLEARFDRCAFVGKAAGNPYAAAVSDGQCQVFRVIEKLIKYGKSEKRNRPTATRAKTRSTPK